LRRSDRMSGRSDAGSQCRDSARGERAPTSARSPAVQARIPASAPECFAGIRLGQAGLPSMFTLQQPGFAARTSHQCSENPSQRGRNSLITPPIKSFDAMRSSVSRSHPPSR